MPRKSILEKFTTEDINELAKYKIKISEITPRKFREALAKIKRIKKKELKEIERFKKMDDYLKQRRSRLERKNDKTNL